MVRAISVYMPPGPLFSISREKCSPALSVRALQVAVDETAMPGRAAPTSRETVPARCRAAGLRIARAR